MCMKDTGSEIVLIIDDNSLLVSLICFALLIKENEQTVG